MPVLRADEWRQREAIAKNNGRRVITDQKIDLLERIKKVADQKPVVVPLYYGHWLGIGRRIAYKFCALERLTNEIFDGWPALSDISNVLPCPTNDTENQIIRRSPERRLFPFVD